MLALWERYRNWLMRKVDMNDEGYDKLCDYLHNRTFDIIIDQDNNRADDGLELREEFYNSIHEKVFTFNEPCKVLEMLVILARRMDSEYVGDPGHDRSYELFWEFLTNLGLDYYNDDNWSEFSTEHILLTWLNREYSANGSGGLFPLKYTCRDQRDINIWAQMLEYINENY